MLSRVAAAPVRCATRRSRENSPPASRLAKAIPTSNVKMCSYSASPQLPLARTPHAETQIGGDKAKGLGLSQSTRSAHGTWKSSRDYCQAETKSLRRCLE